VAVYGMTADVIRFEHLAWTFGSGTLDAQLALQDASLCVRQGEVSALIGPSGAGKSTLVAFANGLHRPRRTGQALVLGCDTGDPAADLGALRARVGLVLQYPQLQLFERFVGDDVAYGPRQLGLSRPELRSRVLNAMSLVGLGEEYVDRRTFSLSGGEMRRVALAGVLAMQPEVLVLDEATAGLDPAGRQKIHELIRTLRANGTTILMVSNDLDQVAELADSVTILSQGRTVASGPVRTVLADREMLLAAGLAPTHAAAVAEEISAHGVSLPGDVLTASDLEEALWQKLRR
jgi:energy-coupling factor transporter ATP-binding protein EcfA2